MQYRQAAGQTVVKYDTISKKEELAFVLYIRLYYVLKIKDV